MTVSLSIKNVPEELAARLRERARRNHRSLQGELLAILEEELGPEVRLTPSEVLRQVRASGLKPPDEATAIIRDDRDSDHGRFSSDETVTEQQPTPPLTVKELSQWVKAKGLKTKSDSVRILREERDAR